LLFIYNNTHQEKIRCRSHPFLFCCHPLLLLVVCFFRD
jgi:hypothetical protein